MSFLTSLRPTFSFTLRCPIPSQTTRHFTTSPASRLARMTIVGRLADAPEITATSTGQDVVRYALGTSHGPKDNRQTTWWKVTSFTGEGAARDLLMALGKGSLLYVEGECSMSKFQTKDGSPASALSIVQRGFEVLDRRDARAEGQTEGE